MNKRSPRRRKTQQTEIIEAIIERLGAQGDGVGLWHGKPLFVPFVLPGERVRAEVTRQTRDGAFARLLEILEPAAERITPACRHFGNCGGCATQHLAAGSAARWKRDRIVEALAKRGLGDEPVAETVSIPPGSRRRATFAYRTRKRGAVIGFNARGSEAIVDLAECPLLDSSLFSLIDGFRALLAEITPPDTTGDIWVTRLDEGADVFIDLPGVPDLTAIETLGAFGREAGRMRLGWRHDGRIEPVATFGGAILNIGGVTVSPPPGAFLQPSAEGEAAIADRVVKTIEEGARVADLFCGLGTFALRLFPGRQVYAADGDAGLISALAATGRVQAEARDLYQRPLVEAELARFDAVVFDPPRAGARAQAEALANAGPKTVVAVSCNPATFARDARILVDGGYGLETVTPVDQFPWSGHVELVAVLRR